MEIKALIHLCASEQMGHERTEVAHPFVLSEQKSRQGMMTLQKRLNRGYVSLRSQNRDIQIIHINETNPSHPIIFMDLR